MEELARGVRSHFDPHLGFLRDAGVSAYYPWHHDVLRADGRPYDPGEARYIRSLTAEMKRSSALHEVPDRFR